MLFCSGQPKPDQANVLAHAQQQIAMQVSFKMLRFLEFHFNIPQTFFSEILRAFFFVMGRKGFAIV